MSKPIPIEAAERIAKEYGYHQVVIIAREVGVPGNEHVTTYGTNQKHCEVAAQIGDHLKFEVMKWPTELRQPFAVLVLDPEDESDEMDISYGHLVTEKFPLDEVLDWVNTHINERLASGDKDALKTKVVRVFGAVNEVKKDG